MLLTCVVKKINTAMIKLDHATLTKHMSYDPVTGVFTWVLPTTRRVRTGSVVGSDHSAGYLSTRLFGKHYYLHVLAWFYVHRVWPSVLIDHINGNRKDNRLANLREATFSQNAANGKKHSDNLSGFKGVRKMNSSYQARIYVDGKHIHIGTFDSPEEAASAYDAASLKYFKDFALTNSRNQQP